ncbi:lysophosphatidylcholine acyltransferase 1-like isoform X2 [Ornithodoros turicata]|uniref:lysophosphatidylcholine acyltransferase 1-like isoform X2 n=1 Tax=Ornithodoros turicata TaxID=34597 RepID=UPI003138D465
MKERELHSKRHNNSFDATHFSLGDTKILPDYKTLKTFDEIDNMSRNIIEEAYTPPSDTVSNPFFFRIHLSPADKIKVALMSVFLVPIRIILVVFFLLITWLGCYIGQIGLSWKDLHEKPILGFRRDTLKPPLAFVMRLMFQCGGLSWSFKGELAKQKKAPILVVGPHSSLLDGVVVLLLGGLSPVTKAASEYIPFFGTILNFIQPVYVKRNDPNSRQNTVREITRRATSKDWSQIIIFPEGTCTNRSCLITFKLGAFVPGVPVQPILIRYPNELNTLTWTWDGPSAFKTLWITLCQLRTNMEIEYLPVYVPSEEEKKDPQLYAENVRMFMAKALQIPVSSYSYDDLKLLDDDASDPNSTIVRFRLQKLLTRNQILFKDLDDEILKVKAIIKSRDDPHVSFSEFAHLVGVQPNRTAKSYFEVIDIDKTGRVDLRCYLAGLWLMHPTEVHRAEKAFETFCNGGDGIGLEDFVQLAWMLLEVPKSVSLPLFEKLDTESAEKVYLDDFRNFVLETPQWAAAFTPNEPSIDEDQDENDDHTKRD